jgi:hypothetical protein
MGVLAPGSAHARPSAQPPIDTSRNFPAPMSAEWPSAFKTVNGGKNNKRDEKIWKIVAYGCQTPSAQRRSDQHLENSCLFLEYSVGPSKIHQVLASS